MQDRNLRPIYLRQAGVSNNLIHNTFDVYIGGIKCPQTMTSLKCMIKNFIFPTIRGANGGISFLCSTVICGQLF